MTKTITKTTKKTNKRTNLKSTRRGPFYWRGDIPYLTVTNILSVIDKPSLRYWYGQEVYRAMVVDPTQSERDALQAPYKASQRAASRGSTVHSIVEAYKASGAVLEGIPEEVQGYATAFYQFMDEVKPDIVEQETTRFDDELMIAGTLDMIAVVAGKTYVIDVKTGKGIYEEVDLQLSAYARMARNNGVKVSGIAALLLETGVDKKPTGKYVFSPRVENFEVFVHAKKLYEWKEREKLIKYGYLKS